ncbi:hypothetical protein RSPO_c00896 [Ralstonia solanacearum Po82]|uniref:Uncharacterized protein n=1 Tax=Ralstonia solanacearum (strain Po82) TaxID=1031711 RepID=F6FYW3_RALS8|nr:hypothetical protein RSPO_c00896 [Ralstonia solanacearum Po82]
MDDLLVSDAVDRALGLLEHIGSRCLVAAGDGLADGLDGGAQTRTQRGVVRVLSDSLACALACLCGVCHGKFPEENVQALRETRIAEAHEYVRNGNYTHIFAADANHVVKSPVPSIEVKCKSLSLGA